ncbi:hypothetical protein QFC19_008436 [Naganishia cerealis]|uniref:Uncharacterized protein n=1 Tax=Naganishia cerealis TaxID=610337 RepID=A0ACC2V284_9TREE|nr:hypothetical protein QFC19_008436 [Naganishia cerealis]
MDANHSSSGPLAGLPPACHALLDAKTKKQLSFAQISEMIGKPEVWTAALFYGQAKTPRSLFPGLALTPPQPDAETLTKLSQVLDIFEPALHEGLGGSYTVHRGETWTWPPKFGDGIMSAIDFRTSVKRKADPKGDRVVITMDGKVRSFVRETITKPEEPAYTFGPWQGAVMLMVGTTLWLSSMTTNMPPEGGKGVGEFRAIYQKTDVCHSLTGTLQNWWRKSLVYRDITWLSLILCAFHFFSQEFDKKRREAKVKAIGEELKKKDKAEKERKEIFAERRRMETLLEGKHSTYVHPKPPRALKVNKAPEGQPGMAMSYMYQAVEGGLARVNKAPILENAPVLMSSTDERYAGSGAKDKTVPTWFQYPSESSSSKDKGGNAKDKSDAKAK